MKVRIIKVTLKLFTMRLLQKKKLILLFLLFTFTSLYAQVDREFWFTIPKENNSHGSINTANDVSLKITAQAVAANVTVSMPLNGTFTTQTVYVPAGTTKVVVLATSFAQFGTIYANPGPLAGKPADGYTNNGLHIVSDNDITVYYDYNNTYNRDLWSLKGKNALGTEFYTPFQNIWYNGGTSYRNAYSDINIVATTNGTVVKITPTANTMGGWVAGNTYTITLNAGQTYSVVAASQKGPAHLIGTHITSTQPIAVTVNDDSDKVGGSANTCLDINGDQLVSVNIIGSKYLVMCGVRSVLGSGPSTARQDTTRGEQVFVVSTHAGTVVTYQDRKGNLLRTSPTMVAGGNDYLSPNIGDTLQDAIFINSNYPIYVYHITGIGCEIGGAILPPITNCTGSNTVSFYRAGDLDDLTLNLMIPYDTSIPFNSPTQSYNFFTVTYQNGTTAPIPGSWFEPVPGAGWAVLKGGCTTPLNRPSRDDIKRYFTSSSPPSANNTFIPAGQAVKIENNKDFFHLGITNGTSGATNKYGYFSSFNSVAPSARVAQTEFPTYLSCFGDTVILQAYGGISYKWRYGDPKSSATTYLSDPTSATPQVYCPPGTHYFYVIILHPSCFPNDTLPITVTVLPEVRAAFETDTTTGCSPLPVQFTNTSKGANRYEWTRKIDNGSEVVFTPANPLSFTEGPLTNKTAPYAPKNYVYKLKASISGACKDSAKKTITVYPEIKASILPIDTIGCSPLLVNFRNLSGGNVTDTSYYWNFGDENTSIIKSPPHLYNNSFITTDTIFKVLMVATSPYICRDTARANITVHPYIKAGFTADTVKGCSPFFIILHNNSLNRKAIGKYFWDFNYMNPAAATRDTLTTGDKDTIYHAYPRNLTNAPISYKILLTVSHKFGNGCPDTISRTVTVYPEGKVSILNPDTVGCNTLTVKFRAQADAGVNQYEWSFGDGGTSLDSNPTHEFVNLTNADKIYKVAVRTLSAQYCSGYDTMLVTVHANLNPQFVIDKSGVCAPYNSTIVNQSIGGITGYRWDFGDNTRDTTSVPSFMHTFGNTTTSPVTYTVRLVVRNIGGCMDSVSHDILVYPEVHAAIGISGLGAYCSPRRADFVNLSNAAATKFFWSFGDNTASTARDTAHYYYNNTSADIYYNPYLIAYSEYNCKDSATYAPIQVYPYIGAIFALDTTNGCNPLTVKITNASTGAYTSPSAKLSWSFGDGSPLWTPSPIPQTFSHTYYNTSQTTQSFFIKLQIAYGPNNLVCPSASSIQTVMVYAPVNPKVSVNRTSVCDRKEITFRDSSNLSSVPYSYKWDFNDGASVIDVYGTIRNRTVVTTHQYENFAFNHITLNPKFTVYSTKGCFKDTTLSIIVFPDVTASITFDDASGCSPLTVPLKNASTTTSTWIRFWDDGNNPSLGFPYTYLPASQIYTNNTDTANKIYRPKLKVAYLYNGSPVCADSMTRTVTVFPKVTAYFSAKDSFQICHPDSVNFANGSRIGSYHLLSGDKRLTYKWTFGDNGSSSSYEPKHLYYNYSYDTPLRDTVWLKINTVYGCRDSMRKYVTIYPKPKAVFDVENSIACPPFPVQIVHKSVAETGSLFYWKFNDGGPDTTTRVPAETIRHTFYNRTPATLTFPIQLTVTTPHNCTSNTSQDINVYPGVIADFDKDSAGCNPFIMPFKDKSQQADSWYWTFGDGLDSRSQSPRHTFLNFTEKDTTYTVTLHATSKVQCYHDTTHTITVYPQPVANFEADPSYFTFSPTSNIVTFNNYTNSGPWRYLWNYDDLTPNDTIMGPVLKHDYQRWGYYNVRLNVWSIHCSDSVTHHITIVAPKPIADFSATENGCVPWTITFADMSRYGNSWYWEFGDGGTYNGQNPPPYEYVKAGKYNVKLTVTGDGGTSYAFKDVEVYPKPIVDFDLRPALVNLDKIKDNGTEVWGARVDFYNKVDIGARFLWEFGDSTKSNEAAPYHIYKSVGWYTVKLGAWTVHECYDEKIKKDTIHVLGQHFCNFPNAFTPNTDGQNDGKYTTPDTRNDVFHPSWEGVVEYKLEIYDRWGEKLFESSDVTVGWNGYYKGKLCKTDVYIWKAKGKYTDGSTFDKAGNLTLLR